MKAIIWAAGLGTRLRPLTEHIPKAMVPVMGYPMVEHALRLCRRVGITDVIINLHYFCETIEDTIRDGMSLGMNVSYSFEEELLENAGAIIKVKDYFEGEPFLAFASDNLTDIDLGTMIAMHQEKEALVTIATAQADDVTKYGIVASDATGRVTSFQEKPSREEALGDQIATCVYAFDPRIFDHLPSEPTKCHFGKEIFPQLIEDKLPVYAYRHNGYWNDIGNPTNYLQANFDILNKKFALDSDIMEREPGIWVGNNVYIDPLARIEPPVLIGNRCHIGPNAVVGPYTVIGHRCTIEQGSRLTRSILWDECILHQDTSVVESVLSKHSRVYAGTSISNLVLGEQSYLGHTKSDYNV